MFTAIGKWILQSLLLVCVATAIKPSGPGYWARHPPSSPKATKTQEIWARFGFQTFPLKSDGSPR